MPPTTALPCPSCDELLPVGLSEQNEASCEHCGSLLAPVRSPGLFARTGAALVDLIVLLCTAGPLHYGLAQLTPGQPIAPGSTGLDTIFQIGTMDLTILIVKVAPFLTLSGLYFVLFQSLLAQTPGQRVFGHRLVGHHGQVPGPLRTTIRYLVTLVGLIPCGLGSVWIGFDTQRRALQDRISNTYVIREKD